MSGHEQISEVGQVTVAGVATEAKQDAQIIQLDEIKSKQDSTNTKLDTIDTDIKAEQPRIIRQNVIPSVSNNLSTNLNALEEWFGIGESTLGVAGIQVMFTSDREFEVEIQQSIDNINWDIKDMWHVLLGEEESQSRHESRHGRTVQAVGNYFRIRLANHTNMATTFLRLSTALCPIVEALPRSLTESGNLKVSIEEDDIAVSNFGNVLYKRSTDFQTHQLLYQMLSELRIMNVHLEEISESHMHPDEILLQEEGSI